MARNIEKDEREAVRRKDQLIQTGFELFSAEGIENVSLNAVAKKANVGIATMYNYFQNKINFVVAISTKIWGDLWNDSLKSYADEISKMNAYEFIEFYTDKIIDIYLERPEILKFSANYKTFINREGATEEQYSEHINSLNSIGSLFHEKYEEAKKNKCIRTDIPESVMFSTLSLTILSMAERYTQGIVWADSHEENHNKELNYIKEMILNWATKK